MHLLGTADPATTWSPGLTATSDDLPPALYGYAAMHLAMRRDAHRLSATLRAQPRDDRALLRWWQQFRDVIVRHHEREDALVWPALAAADPTFATEVADMHDDHAELDAAMVAVDEAVSGLATSGGTLTRAQQSADTFAAVLTGHLEREELVAFHRLAARPSLWAEVEHRIERGMRIRDAAFEVPWVYDGAQPVRLAHLRARMPRPFRPVVSAVWQPRYRRLVATAHRTAVAR